MRQSRAFLYGEGAVQEPSTLVRRYFFNDDLVDNVGGFHGTAQNIVFEDSRNNGRCVRFLGNSNSYATLPGILDYNAATLFIWQKLERLPTSNLSTGWCSFSQFGNINNNNHFPFTNGNIFLNTFTDSRQSMSPTSGFDFTQWHSVAISFDYLTNSWKFYLNGVLIKMTSANRFNNNLYINPITLGVNGLPGFNNNRYSMNGRMDSLTLFNYQMTDSEILSFHQTTY